LHKIETGERKEIAYSKDAVINTESTVNLRSPAFSDLCHKNAAVARYVLVVHSTGYAETQTLSTQQQTLYK